MNIAFVHDCTNETGRCVANPDIPPPPATHHINARNSRKITQKNYERDASNMSRAKRLKFGEDVYAFSEYVPFALFIKEL